MSNRTPKEALREIRNRIVYMYGNIDGTFSPPALKEVCEIADDAISSPITEKSSPVGNAAAMREALVNIRRELNCYCNGCTLLDRMTEEPPDYTCLRDSLLEIERIVAAALSAPPRQCDVGTAEEQSDRFASLCDSYSGCSQCPVKSRWNFANGHKPSCGVLWAQTPYEAQEGGAE